MYTLLEEAMEEAGLQEVETYVSQPQNKVVQFIVTRTIMGLCIAVERYPGSRVANPWWDQEDLKLEGMCTEAWEVEHEEGGKETDRKATYTKNLLGGRIL